MGQYLFDQIKFCRLITLQVANSIDAGKAAVIPEGFDNNVLWNLGHVYVVQEQFAFGFAREPMDMPDGFAGLFGAGSSPVNWTAQPPALAELIELLKEQPKRIRERLTGRLDEAVAVPFTMPGISLTTIAEFLAFNLYHEGMHVQTLKMLKKFI